MTIGAPRPDLAPPAPAALDRLMHRHPGLAAVAAPIYAGLAILSVAFREGHRVVVCGDKTSVADVEHIAGMPTKSTAGRRPLGAAARRALTSGVPDAMSSEACYLAAHLHEDLPAIIPVSQTTPASAAVDGRALHLAQQVHAYGRPGDVLLALTAFGHSRDVVLAAVTARARGMTVIAVAARGDGPLGALADAWVPVPASDPGEAQRSYQAICRTLGAALQAESLDRDRITQPASLHGGPDWLGAAPPPVAVATPPGGRVLMEVPYSCVEREADGHEYPGGSWVVAGGPDGGFSLANDAKFGYDVLPGSVGITVARSPLAAHHDPARPRPGAATGWLDQGIQNFSVVVGPEPDPLSAARMAAEVVTLYFPDDTDRPVREIGLTELDY